MSSTFPQTNPQHQGDRLGFAVVLAFVIHAMVIFGIGFQFQLDQKPEPMIEVTLAQHRSDHAPRDADFLAQQDQQGSGEARLQEEITTDRISEIEGSRLQEAQPIPDPQMPAAAADQLPVISTSNADFVMVPDPAVPAENLKGSEQQLVLPSAVEEIASLRAKLDQKKQEYSKIPRVLLLTAASARAADHAAYLRYWIETVEAIGNRNYPEKARARKIFGSLRLAVVLLPDGSVESIEVRESSGYSVLDQAAVRTVKLAAPFQPFPAEMNQWDKLEIIRTWQYIPGNQLLTD